MNLPLTAPSTGSHQSLVLPIRRVAARSSAYRRVGARRSAPAAIRNGRASTRIPILAFSLIEILIVVALLSVIIIGLVAMFGQVQRAFRTGMTQVDVLEGGRATADLLARDLVSITPSHGSNTVNFYVEIPNVTPLVQPLPGSAGPGRVNLLEDLFFLSRENQTWSGTGYRVSTPDGGVGALYRFSITNAYGRDPRFLFTDYNNTALTNMSRIMDGVVHFKVRAFDTNGVWLTPNLTNNNPYIRWFSPLAPGEVGLCLMSNGVVPAFVEFELGVLEPRALERVKSIPNAASRRTYLEDQAGKVHLFRMRVPVRNVDPAAYQ